SRPITANLYRLCSIRSIHFPCRSRRDLGRLFIYRGEQLVLETEQYKEEFVMKSVLLKKATMLVLGIMLLVTLLLPTSVPAQGRGRGRGLSKKSVKFVNGHDARDGRFDG